MRCSTGFAQVFVGLSVLSSIDAIKAFVRLLHDFDDLSLVSPNSTEDLRIPRSLPKVVRECSPMIHPLQPPSCLCHRALWSKMLPDSQSKEKLTQ